MNWELKVLDFIEKKFHSRRTTQYMRIATLLGEKGIFIGICVLVTTLFEKGRKAACAVAISLSLEAMLCNVLVKPLVDRARPYDIKEKIDLLIPELKDASFPSGHTGATFSAVGALFFSRTRAWIPAAMLAASTAFSRMYFYVHYPTDILGGIFLGMGSGWAAVKLQNRMQTRKK